MNQAVEKIKKETLSDLDIQAFCKKHKLTNEMVDDYLLLLFQQKQANDLCRNCLGKKPCAMDVFNMQSMLTYYQGKVERKYYPCRYLDNINEDLIEMLFFPETTHIGELHIIPERKTLYNAMKKFTNNPHQEKGLYLYGQFGSGKTFVLLKMAKELSKKGIKTIFVYFPDFVRHIKSSFSQYNIEPLIVKLKHVDLLVLDDIGGENNSNYIRDEILGPILQYRMIANKPICMTSNASLEELKMHFSETKDQADVIKSSRIIERITFMMDPIEVTGSNFRIRKVD